MNAQEAMIHDLFPLGPVGSIIRETARAAGLKQEDIIGPGRKYELTWPRHVAMAICRKHTKASLPMIARAFHRDHTSILYAIRAVEEKKTPEIEEAMNEIARRAGVLKEDDECKA